MAILKPVAEAAKLVTTSSQPRANARDCLRALATSIQFSKVSVPNAPRSSKPAGSRTVEDILYHLPFRYEDRRQFKKINQASHRPRGELYRSAGAAAKPVQPAPAQPDADRRCCATTPVPSIWCGIGRQVTWSMDWLKDRICWFTARSSRACAGATASSIQTLRYWSQATRAPMREFLPVYRASGRHPAVVHAQVAAQAITAIRAVSAPSDYRAAIASRQQLVCIPEALSQLHQPSLDTSVNALNRFHSPAHRSDDLRRAILSATGLGDAQALAHAEPRPAGSFELTAN